MRRRAIASEKETIAKNREHERARRELLGGSVRPLDVQRERKSRQMRSAAHETTKSLGSLVQRMSDEVKLSEQTTMIITTSSSTLRDTHVHMNAIGQTIRSGGKLITKYGRRETTDKILLVLALLLYFGVILYILKKRIFRYFEFW